MKKYSVILADPPWQYNNRGCRGNVEDQYKGTLTTDQICSLPINLLSKENSLLLLWCTWPFMEDGLKVCKAWGFNYLTGFPYIKTIGFPQINLFGNCDMRLQTGVGFWSLGCTEIIMICRRGNVSPPEETKRVAGIISPNFGHSRKPDSLHYYAELFDPPYLELFARRKRKGWDVWGNEVESDIDLSNIG